MPNAIPMPYLFVHIALGIRQRFAKRQRRRRWGSNGKVYRSLLADFYSLREVDGGAAGLKSPTNKSNTNSITYQGPPFSSHENASPRK